MRMELDIFFNANEEREREREQRINKLKVGILSMRCFSHIAWKLVEDL